MMAHLRLALLVAAPALALHAQEWPMYLRDLGHSSYNADEQALSADSVGSLQQAWVTKVEGAFSAAPTYVGNTLYVGDWKGNFHAIDAGTGNILWSQFVGISPPPEDPNCSPALGVSAQAAVVGETVYVAGGDSAVYALKRDTGELLWRVPIANPDAGAYLWASITPYRGSLYVGVASLGDCPLVRGSLVRLDPNDPTNYQTAWLAPEGEEGGGIWSTPAVDEETGLIYVTTGTGDQDVETGMFGGTFAALDADTMQMKLHYFLPTNSIEGDIEWGSSPTLFTTAQGDRLVAATGKDGVLYALRRDDLSLAWTAKVAVQCICPQCGCGSLSTPAWDGKTLFVGAGVSDPESFASGTVWAVDPATGAALWRRETDGVVIAPVTVANGLVYAPTSNGLVILDAASGQPLWNDGDFGLLYSQAVVSDGTVFTTYFSGQVAAWKPSPANAAPQP